MDLPASPSLPVIQSPVPHGLLLELVEAFVHDSGSAEAEASSRCVSTMLAVREVLFLGQGPLHVWTQGEHAWAALEIASSQGVFYLTNAGLMGSLNEARQQARQQLGPFLREDRFLQPSHASLQGVVDLRDNRLHEARVRASLERYGLGMHFSVKSGVDRNALDLEALQEELWQFSCHPYFARAIHKDLVEHGQRSTTTQFFLVRSFHEIVAAVAPLGIELCRSWVKPHAGDSNHVPVEEPLPGPPRRFKM